MPYSSSLTDEAWVMIEPLLPKKKENLSHEME
ncbi:MAG: transposase [Trichodesmium sp. ALOHA_ZT_67]|nr:transposase [Trichodesmium sp. ALOHA_ZT_67]MDT9338572.1 transposase [Trichodesmium erythraeum 21-75]